MDERPRGAAATLGPSGSARSRSTTGDPHVDRMVNIWNPYQCMVTFNLSRSASHVRVGHRARDGLPRLEPGPAGLRAHGPRARPRADPGHRRDPAARRRRLSPVPAADEARQPRRRLGVQRRPARGSSWASRPTSRRRATCAILDEPVPWDNAEGSRDAAPRSPPAVASSTRCDRLGPHGLPLIGRADWNDCLNLNVLLRPSPASRSRRRRTAPAASPSRCSSPGCSCSRRARRRRSPACAATTREAARCRAAARDDRRDRGARLGRRVVPTRLRPRRARRWARPRTTRARSSSSRRA